MDNLERLIINQAWADYQKETQNVINEIKLIIDKHLIKHGLDGRVVSLSITTDTFTNSKEFPQSVSFIHSDDAKRIIYEKAINDFFAKLKNTVPK